VLPPRVALAKIRDEGRRLLQGRHVVVIVIVVIEVVVMAVYVSEGRVSSWVVVLFDNLGEVGAAFRAF
jgi:hypothetical protein